MPPQVEMGRGWNLNSENYQALISLARTTVYAKWPIYYAELAETDTPTSNHIPDEIVAALEDFPQYFEYDDEKHLLYKWVASPRHLELIRGMEWEDMNSRIEEYNTPE